MKSNLLPLAAAIIFVFTTSACGTSGDADAGTEPETQLPAVVIDDPPEIDDSQSDDESVDDTSLGDTSVGDAVDDSDGATPIEPKDPVDDDESEPADADLPVSEIELNEVAAAIEGLELSEASDWADERSMSVRVVQQDGEALMVTMDFSLSRINIAADGKVVTEVLNFG